MAELELQPIGSQQMIHQRGIPSDLFIMQGDTAVAIIDVADFEHLKIQEVAYAKQGLHVSLAAPDRLVIYTNEKNALKRNFITCVLTLE